MNGEQRADMAAAVARIDERTKLMQDDIGGMKDLLVNVQDEQCGAAIDVAGLQERVKGTERGVKRLWTLLSALALSVLGWAAKVLWWEGS